MNRFKHPTQVLPRHHLLHTRKPLNVAAIEPTDTRVLERQPTRAFLSTHKGW